MSANSKIWVILDSSQLMVSSFENWSHFPGSYTLNILDILDVKHGDSGSYYLSTRYTFFSFSRHLTLLEVDYKLFFLGSSFYLNSDIFVCFQLIFLDLFHVCIVQRLVRDVERQKLRIPSLALCLLELFLFLSIESMISPRLSPLVTNATKTDVVFFSTSTRINCSSTTAQVSPAQPSPLLHLIFSVLKLSPLIENLVNT